ncbi:MAG TPA: ABC transporter permease [Candidatus Limnocylindrales bacterium]|nr:ABC transporter permease [Candidatus Limnocylindrales bacterium]
MSRRRAIWLVARRELIERGRSRAFLLSLLLTVALISLGVFLPSLIGRDRATLGIVGPPPAGLAQVLEARADASGLSLVVVDVPSIEEAEARLRDGKLDAALELPADGSAPEFVVKTTSNSPLYGVVQSTIFATPQLAARELVPADPNQGVAFAFANAGVVLLFISIFTFGTWLLTGVVEEKTSRVVEVVLSTVESRDLLIGKVLGIGILGIVQLTLMVAIGLGVGVGTGRFSLPPSTPNAVAMLLLWFVLGYAFYSTALGVLGALASRMEEASNAASPVSLLATAAYLFSLVVALQDPDGTPARIATFLPPVSPMVIPLRAALGAIEPWEIALAVALMLAAIWILFVIGGRVYSGAILQTGARMRLRDAWRLARGR